MKFTVWRYPRSKNPKPLGSLQWGSTHPLLILGRFEDWLRLMDYMRENRSVYMPEHGGIPFDPANETHQRMLCSTMTCIGYEVLPEELVGKDAEFESKHPRSADGRFAGSDGKKWDGEVAYVGGDEDEVSGADLDAAWKIAHDSPIRILRDKELTALAKEDGHVVGALFTSLQRDEFSFDVVVTPDAQGKGIGTRLTEEGMQMYRNIRFDVEDLKLSLDVVNPRMVPVLERMGLKVTQQVGGHTLMTLDDQIGKDREFEEKHPRDEAGKFATGAGQTDTPEFKAWFGNSKVVDKDGSPLVVYHGTPNGDFTVFEASKRGTVTRHPASLKAFYFGTDKDAVEVFYSYKVKEGEAIADVHSRVMPCYLSLQNPLVIEAKALVDFDKKVMAIEDFGNHDGVVARIGGNDVVFGVFRPEQIKSATGNSGAFDPQEKDITKALVAKDREFEEKHPRDQSGRFAESPDAPAAIGDLSAPRREYVKAARQSGHYALATEKLNTMASLLHGRGADRMPQLVSESELNRRVSEGETELWRGLPEKRYATRFRGGPLHLGTGIMGSGVYVALGGAEARSYAADYAGQQGELLHMSLAADAKVGDWQTVASQMAAEARKLNMTDPVNRTLYSDVGLYGAARGYDALLSQKLAMGLVLNRAKLRVSRQNAIAKSLLTAGGADLSRRVARCMDTERMASLVADAKNYPDFVEAVLASNRFVELPDWVKEEIGEAELEMN